MTRHGEILSNKKDIYAGWSDEELTEEGRVSADTLGKETGDWNIEAIYSSPIRRAMQTAEIINGHIGTELFIEDGFKEIRMGPWEGLPINDVASLFPEDFNVWMTRPGELKLKGRETLAEVQARAVEAVKKIFNAHNGAVLAVTHVAIIRCLQLYFDNESLNLYKKISVPNVSVFRIKETGKDKYEMKRVR